MKEFIKGRKNKLFVALVIVSAIVIAFFGALSLASQKEAPAQFTEAREKAASVSREIVGLTGLANKKIGEASDFEIGGKKAEALARIEEARIYNNDAYNKALELSGDLRALASSLSRVPKDKRYAALEATAIELSLVQEFISYTKNLNSFFDSLTEAIRTGNNKNREEVNGLLATVNKNAEKINSLNEEFLKKMRDFDGSF
jgi:hypothetical protein